MSSSSLWVRLRPFRRCFFTHSRALVIAPKSKDEQGHVEDKWKTMIFDEKSATGFENTTTLELLRAAVVVRLSANDYISNNAITLMHRARKVVGKRLFHVIMRSTFYGHFCAGNNKEEVKKSTKTLLQNNVRPMILVAIEEESRDANASKSDVKGWFENNKKVILECIETCNRTQDDSAPRYIHFRLTALFSSKLLTKITQKLKSLRPNSLEANELYPEEDCMDLKLMLDKKSFHNILDSDESEELLDGLKHFAEVGEKAEKLGINVLVDAEYTSFNPAIRAITHIMMMKFNRNKPILQYTFQGYLICSAKEADKSIEFCRKQNIHFGAKIVRGAYMVMERHLAKVQEMVDPICKDKDATNESYNGIVSNIINKIDVDSNIQLMVACHNDESINLAIGAMKNKGIEPKSGKVIFGQTYGLSDYISNWLGNNNFLVYKSTPIGSIDDTLPYLHRRAQENKAALDFRMDKELISRELGKRLWYRTARHHRTK